jgi:hypothetical protein
MQKESELELLRKISSLWDRLDEATKKIESLNKNLEYEKQMHSNRENLLNEMTYKIRRLEEQLAKKQNSAAKDFDLV